MEVDIVGAVLAGGASTRMGHDKAALLVGGKTLADRAEAVLREVFEEVAISTSRSDAGGDRIRILDRWTGCGPLAALEAVLAYAAGRPAFVLACDLPMVDATLVRRIVEAAGTDRDADGAAAWIAQSRGRDQPLCGLYTAACLPKVREGLTAGSLSISDLLETLEVSRVTCGEGEIDRLLNVNRPQDLERVKELLDAV